MVLCHDNVFRSFTGSCSDTDLFTYNSGAEYVGLQTIGASSSTSGASPTSTQSASGTGTGAAMLSSSATPMAQCADSASAKRTVGLGVGLGLGIPLLAALAALAFMFKSRRKPEPVAQTQPFLPAYAPKEGALLGGAPPEPYSSQEIGGRAVEPQLQELDGR